VQSSHSFLPDEGAPGLLYAGGPISSSARRRAAGLPYDDPARQPPQARAIEVVEFVTGIPQLM